jgi:hypothetical protein
VDKYPASAESVLPSGGTFRFGGELRAPQPAASEPAASSTGTPARVHASAVPAAGEEAEPQRSVAQAPSGDAGAARPDRTLRILVVMAGLVLAGLAAVFLRGARK